MNSRVCMFLLAALVLLVSVTTTSAQGTAFMYQGTLDDNSVPANGNYDFEFALFDSLNGGSQVGATLQVSSVAVTDGSFSVTLDFGAQFPGTGRFLEIRVRQAAPLTAKGETADLGAYSTLSPRQPVNSVPYAVRSISAGSADSATTAATATNSTQLGGVAANQYVQTGDPRLTDARTPTAGSPDYIQNTTVQQALSNFSISGTGQANVFNADTQYDILGIRVLSLSGTVANLLVGPYTGEDLTSGTHNTFVGFEAGTANTTGRNNSFTGDQAGYSNTTGERNSFFGREAGFDNTIGSGNSFFGHHAGLYNTEGLNNSFLGAFVGRFNQTGDNNSFFGRLAGDTNTSGSNNTAVGSGADVGGSGLNYATAVGSGSVVSSSNTIQLGRPDGSDNVSTFGNLGIGNDDPSERIDVRFPGSRFLLGDAVCGSGTFAAIGFLSTLDCTNYSLLGNGTSTFINAPGGGSIYFREGNLTNLWIKPGGVVALSNLGSAGSTPLCRNGSNEIATCSSSIRYKSDVAEFHSGLSLIRELRPVSFRWTNGGMLDLGLVAEEVADIEPLLVTYNTEGQVEGVKYDRIGVVLVNVVREQAAEMERQKEKVEGQKAEIESLREELKIENGKFEAQGDLLQKQGVKIETLEAELAALKALVCSTNPEAAACKR